MEVFGKGEQRVGNPADNSLNRTGFRGVGKMGKTYTGKCISGENLL